MNADYVFEVAGESLPSTAHQCTRDGSHLNSQWEAPFTDLQGEKFPLLFGTEGLTNQQFPYLISLLDKTLKGNY